MPTSACICVHCGRSFQCERALQKHMACHDDRKLKCEQCSKEFSGVKALKKHERSHKSAECAYCLKTLPKNTKYSHQLTCSERRDSTNFNCDKCPYESPYESPYEYKGSIPLFFNSKKIILGNLFLSSGSFYLLH